ncbi:TLC domain-containing protein LALA0_S02e02190g [Lachancea lanzarotensis]|uniref:LALA0S02e02190g1_1 n=1 Tax=Lachancea lanzarotensis TaxID=1245769 RepID=A0A0C7MM13_9SACH|nr:uncharacterized protein LALA0_S02e02190g [Lachancea lanzarotensis]CEP60898.1 LALA0S02e02190g1_1 [Lachancea lanzarotensis]
MSSRNLMPPVRPRRTSSVGAINLGDTKVPGLSTMRESEQSKTAAKARMRALSETSKGDADLLRKFWLTYREMSYRNTWLTPLLILVVVYGAYFTSGNRTESNPLHAFVAVSYQVGDSDMYGKGIRDLYFVFFYMIFFTFLREFLMEAALRPLAKRMGITGKQKIKRVMEQTYSIIYYGISGPFGLYIMYHSDLWLFATAPMYATYPDFANPFLYKVFYLGQAAFWTQQACVLALLLEKPRKDFKELIFHHIVTLSLIWLSYVFHFTKMGLAVYITMDVSDFFLSLSKTLNYMDSVLTPPFFVFFVVSWTYLRHYVNIKILWSLLTEFRTVGNYTLNFATQQYKCWISLPIVFVLISALQLVNLYWLFLILRILYRLLFKGIQKDDRSDSESEDEPESPVSETYESSKMDTKKEL